MSTFKGIVCSTLALACLAGSASFPVRADKPKPTTTSVKSYKWKKYTFQGPAGVALGDPQSFGESDKTSFFCPPDVKPGEPRIRVFMADVSIDSFKQLNPRGKLLQAQVTTHMGLGKDPSGAHTRNFFGKDVEGKVWVDSGPPTKSIEGYVAETPSGDHLFIAAFAYDALSRLINEVRRRPLGSSDPFWSHPQTFDANGNRTEFNFDYSLYGSAIYRYASDKPWTWSVLEPGYDSMNRMPDNQDWRFSTRTVGAWLT